MEKLKSSFTQRLSRNKMEAPKYYYAVHENDNKETPLFLSMFILVEDLNGVQNYYSATGKEAQEMETGLKIERRGYARTQPVELFAQLLVNSIAKYLYLNLLIIVLQLSTNITNC